MRRRVWSRLFAVGVAFLIVGGTTWLGARVHPLRPDRPSPRSERLVVLEPGVLPPVRSDRVESLRDWTRRDKPSGLLTGAHLLAAGLLCVLLAARQLVAARVAGRALRGIARSFAARSPPLLQPV